MRSASKILLAAVICNCAFFIPFKTQAYTPPAEAANMATAVDKKFLTLNGLEPLFERNLHFSPDGYGPLQLGIPVKALSAVSPVKVYPYDGGCENRPSIEFTALEKLAGASGEYGMNVSLVHVKDNNSILGGNFELVFSEGKLSSVDASGDTRFQTSEGLSIGSKISSVREIYKMNPNFLYKEAKGDKKSFWEVDIKRKQKNSNLLRVKMLGDYVIGFSAFTLGAKLQAHDCGDFLLLK